MADLKSNILAIDSSTSTMRIGLTLAGGELVSRSNTDRFRHAEFIFGLIDDLLIEHGLHKNSLTAIIVSTGPGSFTGLRVGLAAAKGLATALNIPIAGVSTYRAAARRINEELGKTVLLIRSRRNEYYVGIIEADEFDDKNIRVLKAEQVLAQIGDARVLGIDFDLNTVDLPQDKIIKPAVFSIEIEDLMTAGIRQLELSGPSNMATLEPLYIQTFPAGG